MSPAVVSPLKDTSSALAPLHRVLVFSRDRDTPETLGRSLRVSGCHVKFCDLESALWENLQTSPWDVVVHDLDRTKPFSVEPYARWHAAHPESRLWFMTEKDAALPPDLAALANERFVRLFHRPLREEELFQALREDAGGAAARTEAQILLAHPDPVFCEDLLDFLAMEGHRARTARRADEAIEEARRQFYNIALVDTRLPDMSVWDLAARLHEVQSHMVVIVMADYASLETVLQAMRADVYDYLLTPLDAFAFRRTLGRALDKQSMGLQIQSLLGGLRKANDDLLRLNDLKSQFLRVVSHDLRTPLTAVKGYAQALQSGMIAAPKYDRCFDTMVRECEHLEHLISDLVDFVSIESGKMRLERYPCDPKRVFSGVVARFEEPMERKKVRYRVTGLNQSWPPFRLDPRRLDQVLSNLIGNALKHTPEGGTVSVDFHRRGKVLEVKVVDTGAGLSAQHLPHVFEQFFQVETSPMAKTGLGLGLAIAREIVRRHGGEIGVSSAGPGKGSTFWFTLPSEQIAADGPADASRVGRKRVLK